jgi:hypothetical protein
VDRRLVDGGVAQMQMSTPGDAHCGAPVQRSLKEQMAMPLLATSAAGANCGGDGLLLAFDRDGTPLGSFSTDDRIADPRGLGVHQQHELLFLNSGADRVLALDRNGKVVRDTGAIEGLDPGGGNFGPDALNPEGQGNRSATLPMLSSTE